MQPSYPLEQVKQLFQQRKYWITETALQGAAMMNFLEEEIVDCVTNCLGDSHFYKSGHAVVVAFKADESST